jgi:hypothetical protein
MEVSDFAEILIKEPDRKVGFSVFTRISIPSRSSYICSIRGKSPPLAED